MVSLVATSYTGALVAQDNNQSIGEELKRVWGSELSSSGSEMDGMTDREAETGTPPTMEDDVTDAPVDGGIGFLLAAGLGYGANRLRRRKQKEGLDENSK